MQVTDPVALPYAEALVGLASDRGVLADVRDQVAALLAAFVEAPTSLLVLESPRIAPETKYGVIDRALRERLDDGLCNFLAVVIRRGRATHLRAILEEGVRQADVALGRVAAKVQVARPLDDAARTAIAEALAQATGKTVEVDVRVRPELVGGTRIRVGDRVVDATIRARLRAMRRRLDTTRLTVDVFQEDGK